LLGEGAVRFVTALIDSLHTPGDGLLQFPDRQLLDFLCFFRVHWTFFDVCSDVVNAAVWYAGYTKREELMVL
jgi:hypothetical protein